MNAVDFKYLNKRLDSGLPQETAVKNAGSMENLDSSPYLNKPKSRNLKEMLGDVREYLKDYFNIVLIGSGENVSHEESELES